MSSPPHSARPAPRLPIIVLGLLLTIGGFGVGACRLSDEQNETTATSAEEFEGRWQIVKSESNAIDPWNDLQVDLAVDPTGVRLVRTWRGAYGYTGMDSIHVPADGAFHRSPLDQWPDNRHIGAFARTDRTRRVSLQWIDQGRTLRVESRFWVEVSQGTRQIRTYAEYRLAPNGERLVILELRSTRPRARRYVLERSDASENPSS